MEASGNVQFTAEQLAAIQSIIDQKVEERMAKFQSDYDDLMNKVKKQISSAIKPSSLLPKTGGLGAKTRDQGDEETKDTPSTGSGSTTNRMSLAGGLKRPGA